MRLLRILIYNLFALLLPRRNTRFHHRMMEYYIRGYYTIMRRCNSFLLDQNKQLRHSNSSAT